MGIDRRRSRGPKAACPSASFDRIVGGLMAALATSLGVIPL